MKKILVIEDDEVIREELAELLRKDGYQVIEIKTFENIEEEILAMRGDLILLDINIPSISGEVLLQNIRKKSSVPIIMVTSRNSEIDEALSISYGADDYITKPYNPHILLLRIGAVLRRSEHRDTLSHYQDLEIDFQKGTIKKDTKEIVLTKNEAIIFHYLLQHQNKIVTRDALMTDLWDNHEYINDNALTVNISRLRAKLKEIGQEEIIETRKGQGYLLK